MSCFNNIRYTRGFVESVQKNSRGHEVAWHIVDNGSTDKTHQYLKSIRPRFLERLGTNGSVALAWNKALGESVTGGPDLICLANNDVLVGEHWLEPIQREYRAHQHEKVYWVPNELRVQQHEFQGIASRNLRSFASQVEPIEHILCIAFFRPESIPVFHPIPERLTLWFGDNWIDARLAKQGHRLFVVKDSSVLHFVSKTIEITPDVSARIERDKQAWAEISKTI